MSETPPNQDEPDVAPEGEPVAEAGAATATLQEAELTESGPGGDDKPMDMDFILDIPLTVRVEVGRTRLLIQELLQLGQGSVIELDKLMGEPFEVLVNEKLVARGEIVVVNDRFGVRLTDIVSPTERVQSLA